MLGCVRLAALRASQVHRRTLRIAALVAFVAFLAALVSVAITTSDDATGALFVLNILIVAAAPIAIANALWHRPVVDIHSVLGAICIYVLMGMMFAFLYARRCLGSAVPRDDRRDHRLADDPQSGSQ